MAHPTVSSKIPVAVLGATGPVGQKAISLLQSHPGFYVAEVAASARSEGKVYRETVLWKDENPLSQEVGSLLLKNPLELQSKLIISALPALAAVEVEPALARRGQYVFSNASAFRMDPSVPLMIPEINREHLCLLERQPTAGKIVANPNCVVAVLAPALAPLQKLARIQHLSVVSLQAVSGAGYPGVPSMDILGNVIPHIEGEEQKIQLEVKKILGQVDNPADFDVAVHVTRVPVLHGHSIVVHARFESPLSVKEVQQAYEQWNLRYPGLFQVHKASDRPQPARDLTPTDFRVHIGRIKVGEDPRVIGFFALGHNLVRGAAGAALLNLESFLDYSRSFSLE